MVSRVLGFIVCRYLTVIDRSDSVSGILSALADQSSVSSAAIVPSSPAGSGAPQSLLSLPNACLLVINANMTAGAFDKQQYEQTQHLLAKLIEVLNLADGSR